MPQFHQIPENDKWWGTGYTEWTAIKNWKPSFDGHTIRKPSDELGYYKLDNLNTIQQQFNLAKKYDIEGFCIWSYWFGGGVRLLEKPMDLLLAQPNDVKYCIAWANHSWFDKSTWTMLQKQNYLGEKDYAEFFNQMLPHFKNKNYILDSNRPVVSIFMAKDIPDFEVFISSWNKLAVLNGFSGIFFISDQFDPNFKFNHLFQGFSHSPELFRNRNVFQKIIERLIRYHSWHFLGPMKYSYEKLMENLFSKFLSIDKFIPTVFTGWDTTPRHGKRGVVMTGFTPATFTKHVRQICDQNFKSDYIFVKSWNEWAEGNTLEPDQQYGEEFLKILQQCNRNST